MEIIGTADLDITLASGEVKTVKANIKTPDCLGSYEVGKFIHLAYANGEQYSGNFGGVEGSELILRGANGSAIGLPISRLTMIGEPIDFISTLTK